MSDLYKNVDGVRIKLTEDEVKQREKDEQDFIDDIPERLKRRLRNKREDLLLEADYKINTLVDNNQDASAWRTYRQELRDITKASDLENVTFPTKPS